MNTSRLAIGVAALALSTAAGAGAHAAPCANFQVLGTDLHLNYDPFSPTPVDHPFLLRVRRLSPAVAGVRFILLDATPSQGRSRIGSSGPFDYNIVWLANTGQQVFYYTNQMPNVANSVSTSFGPGPAGDVETLNFALQIPPGQPVAASRQFENIEVVYQCVTGASFGPTQIQDDSRLRIHLSIPRYFGAYIGSPGRNRGEIDFGTLRDDTSAAEKHVAVTAVSTVPYTIAVSTDRGSELKRSEHDADGIPYTMQFANLPVQDRSMLVCPMTKTALGDTEQLKVKLAGDHLHQLHAGVYRDTITLTFTPSDTNWRGDGCTVR